VKDERRIVKRVGTDTNMIPAQPEPQHWEPAPEPEGQDGWFPGTVLESEDPYKVKHVQRMTAALMWFVLVSVLLIVGAFVVKLAGAILS